MRFGYLFTCGRSVVSTHSTDHLLQWFVGSHTFRVLWLFTAQSQDGHLANLTVNTLVCVNTLVYVLLNDLVANVL